MVPFFLFLDGAFFKKQFTTQLFISSLGKLEGQTGITHFQAGVMEAQEAHLARGTPRAVISRPYTRLKWVRLAGAGAGSFSCEVPSLLSDRDRRCCGEGSGEKAVGRCSEDWVQGSCWPWLAVVTVGRPVTSVL